MTRPIAPKGEGRLKRSGVSGSVEMVVRPRVTTMPDWWQLGRRVWLRVIEGRIEITRTPKGRRQGQRVSRRVKRGLFSLQAAQRRK